MTGPEWLLSDRIDLLEARVAELEKRPAWGISTGSTISVQTSWWLACPRCGHDTQHKLTGNILTSMPPQTEIACVVCGSTRGMR